MRVALISVFEKTPGVEEIVGIGLTDASGRYRLEALPGSYYLAGGRLRCPTYYPGTREQSTAVKVDVTSGATKRAADFIGSIESLYRPSVVLGDSQPCNQSEWPPILKAFLAGSTHFAGGAAFIFTLDDVMGRTITFGTDSGLIKRECDACSVLVRDGKLTMEGDSGILFRLSPDGLSLGFTCQFKGCQVISVPPTGVPVVRALKTGDTGSVQISHVSAFAIIP